jgi:hypothetical protein
MSDLNKDEEVLQKHAFPDEKIRNIAFDALQHYLFR